MNLKWAQYLENEWRYVDLDHNRTAVGIVTNTRSQKLGAYLVSVVGGSNKVRHLTEEKAKAAVEAEVRDALQMSTACLGIEVGNADGKGGENAQNA